MGPGTSVFEFSKTLCLAEYEKTILIFFSFNSNELQYPFIGRFGRHGSHFLNAFHTGLN